MKKTTLLQAAAALFFLISALCGDSMTLHGQEAVNEYKNNKDLKKSEEKKDIKEIIKKKGTRKLDTVVVSATKTKERLIDVPVNVEVISKKEIRESGINSVGDIIGKIITGHYHRYSGLLQPVGLRGLRSNTVGDDIKGHVLILIDGHRVGTGNMGKIPSEIIEQIEIIKGPSSALYGSAAMGGIVNIITKKGKDKNPSASVRAEYGSFNYLKGSASSSGQVTKYMSYYIMGAGYKVDDYDSAKFGRVFNSRESQKYTMGNFTFYPVKNFDFRIGYFYTDIKAHSPDWYNISTISFSPYRVISKNTFFDRISKSYTDKSHANADLECNLKLLDGKIHWKGVVYFLWDRNQWYYGDPLTEFVEWDHSKYDNTTWGTDQQVTLKLIPYNKLTIGYTHETLEKKAAGKSNGIPSIPYTPGMLYKTNSLYLQDVVSILRDRLKFIAGLRYDKFDVRSSRADTGIYTLFIERDLSYYSITPRGGIIGIPLDFLRLRCHIGQGFRTPSADQLSAQFEYGGWRRVIGNPYLKSEKSTTYEAGFDINPDHFIFSFTYSFTEITDMIGNARFSIPFAGQNWSTYENYGRADTESLDFGIEWKVGRMFDLPIDIDLSSKVTYNTKFRDREMKRDLNYVSDIEAKSSIRLGYKERISVSFSNVYVGKQNIEFWDYYITYPLTGGDIPIILKKDPFYFFDLTCSVKIIPELQLDVGIYNISNEKYEWVHGYPMAGRNFKIALTGTLEICDKDTLESKLKKGFFKKKPQNQEIKMKEAEKKDKTMSDDEKTENNNSSVE